MKVDITDIVSNENKSVTKEVEIDLTSFDSKLGNFPIIKKTPFTLQLTNEENKHLLIETELDVTLEIPCDRCLTPVDTDFHISVSRKLPIGGEPVSEEDGEEDDYVDGFDLDVDRLIYGEIMVNWPTKVLCKGDCKGICRSWIQEWPLSRISLTNLRRCNQMSICPKNKSSKGRRDKRRANWKMTAPNLVKCSKCGALMMPHRVCKNCGSYNKKEIIPQD